MISLNIKGRSGGFTLIELLVPLAIIAILICDLTAPTLDGVRASAVAAARYPQLQAVATHVLESVGTQVGAAEAPVEQAIGRARALLAAEEAGQVPDAQELSAILEELQSGEAEFHQDLADLRNLALPRGTDAREAYVELRRNLGMAIVELRVLEDNFMHQLQIVERLQ